MKRSRPKKISDRGKIIKRLDTLFRTYMLKNRINKCQWCGKPGKNLQVSHILPKGAYPRLRFRQENVLLLCYYCHFHRWHKSPLEAATLMNELEGEGYKEELLALNAIQSKQTTFYLEALELWLKEMTKQRT